MDALTFGSSVLLRHLTFSEARFVSVILLVKAWLTLILKLSTAISMRGQVNQFLNFCYFFPEKYRL